MFIRPPDPRVFCRLMRTWSIKLLLIVKFEGKPSMIAVNSGPWLSPAVTYLILIT